MHRWQFSFYYLNQIYVASEHKTTLFCAPHQEIEDWWALLALTYYWLGSASPWTRASRPCFACVEGLPRMLSSLSILQCLLYLFYFFPIPPSHLPLKTAMRGPRDPRLVSARVAPAPSEGPPAHRRHCPLNRHLRPYRVFFLLVLFNLQFPYLIFIYFQFFF